MAEKPLQVRLDVRSRSSPIEPDGKPEEPSETRQSRLDQRHLNLWLPAKRGGEADPRGVVLSSYSC